MKYKVIFPEEKATDTIKQININYGAFTEKLRSEKEKLNTSEVEIFKRGEYWLIVHDNVLIYHEWHNKNYPFFEDAIHFMNPDNIKKWKMVRTLITFRQAIREASVQGYITTEDYLYEDISKVDYDTFLRVARKYDKIHHGQVTF